MRLPFLPLLILPLSSCQAPLDPPGNIERTEAQDTPTPSDQIPDADAAPHDVIFLTIDTLRFDHVSSQNSESPAKTPHIDALAQQGLSFTQTYAPVSVTGPSFITLFTGLFPRTHGALMNVFRGGNGLDASFDTLTKRLKTAGFSTGAFVSGFTLRPELGLDQGFDSYRVGIEDTLDGIDLTEPVRSLRESVGAVPNVNGRHTVQGYQCTVKN